MVSNAREMSDGRSQSFMISSADRVGPPLPGWAGAAKTNPRCARGAAIQLIASACPANRTVGQKHKREADFRNRCTPLRRSTSEERRVSQHELAAASRAPTTEPPSCARRPQPARRRPLAHGKQGVRRFPSPPRPDPEPSSPFPSIQMLAMDGPCRRAEANRDWVTTGRWRIEGTAEGPIQSWMCWVKLATRPWRPSCSIPSLPVRP